MYKDRAIEIMSDGCYKRSNRRSNGSDGSGSKEWIKEKFEGGSKEWIKEKFEGAMDQGLAVVQKGTEGAIIMFNIYV